ncbi:NADPH-dependent oxidoreductase [Acetobacterium paludosum]|uniref:NADPH-dependent oxidoreductase n=1 Tax=Acetobacterium paludosum TaxID=52693 RepID=A0A923HXG9_9FIRM|nr:NAD(P)H-dependent oxidoreductase [Acetobacterium paludosum]MBC3888970.1 NADPH-dependent oxidoreductase [Acetobacterium paludosum]
MKVAVIHGQAHQGNTYHVTHQLIEQLECKKEDVEEFNVNGLEPCVGCFNCILKDEKKCPHYEQMTPMIEAIDAADVIIVDSPNYCMGMTGQLKTFFDHLAYRWFSHRPNGKMTGKIAVAISTTAGGGAKGTTRDIAKQLFWLGIGKTYRISEVVGAWSCDQVTGKKQQQIAQDVNKVAVKIKRKVGKVKPGLKTMFVFKLFKMMQKGMVWNPVDTEYWKMQGWIK